MKDSYYFSHDYGARNDPKLQRLLMCRGLEGLGLYWCLVETLYEQGGSLPLDSLEGLAFSLHCAPELALSVVRDFGLFEVEDGRVTCRRVASTMELRERIRESRRRSGRRGARARWDAQKGAENGKDMANAIENDSNCHENDSNCHENDSNCHEKTWQNIAKESKGKEIKEEDIREENSLSLSLPLEERGGGLPPAEREGIISIFFFRGVLDPEAEADAFINHYEARGWVPNNTTRAVSTAKGRAALARNWRPKSGEDRWPVGCSAVLAWLRQGYDKAVRQFGPEKAGAVLRDITEIRVLDKADEFSVRTTAEVYGMLTSVDNPLVPGAVGDVRWLKSYKQTRLEEGRR